MGIVVSVWGGVQVLVLAELWVWLLACWFLCGGCVVEELCAQVLVTWDLRKWVL